MKCPKCNYTSFDHLTSCKKCGYVFKKGEGSEKLVSFKSPPAGNHSKKGENTRSKKSLTMPETVASIRSVLQELEGEELPATGAIPQEEAEQMGEDTPQLLYGGTAGEESQPLPSFPEVNWEESISLSGDETPLDFDEGTSGEPEKGTLRFKEENLSAPEEVPESFKKELVRVEEELEQIEGTPETPEPAPPPTSPQVRFDLSTAKKGGFWIRVVASIIDGAVLVTANFILVCVGILAMGVGFSGLETLEEGGVDSVGFILPFYLCSYLINIVYYTYFHGATGQTPGKMACGIKVVRVNGEPLGYGKAFLRWLGYLVSSIVFCLGYLWVAWDTHKQGWHDKIAGTCVIKL